MKEATKVEPAHDNVTLHGLTKVPNPDYRNHPAYGKLFGKPGLSTRIAAFRRLWPYFRAEVKWALYRLRRARRSVKSDVDEASPLLQVMLRDGVAGMRLQPDQIATLSESLRDSIESLEARRARIPAAKRDFLDNALGISEDEKPEIYAQVTELLNNDDILAAASGYLGFPVRVRNINIMIYDGSESHWRNRFPDTDVLDPRTVYMHMDSSTKLMKVIIYLTPVSKENGPFTYVVGSNRLKIGTFENIVRKANDKSRLDRTDRENRMLFSALPKLLQKKCEIGNDLIDSTPESEVFLACEREFTSEEGNMLFFDNAGIHRGGMLREGKRRIVQILLGP